MTSTRRKVAPAWIIVAVTFLVLFLVLWLIDRSPRTDDAYVYADTVNIVPEVSGRIIELAVRDNQAVKRGDLLFRIDPRPFQQALAEAKARLGVLNQQIMLTQRTVDAQEYNAAALKAGVERAKALASQAQDTYRRTSPLLSQGFASAEEVDQARTAQRSTQAALQEVMLQARQAAAAVSGVDALVAQRAEVHAQIALAELHLEFTEVRAPIDGRVVSLRTTVGQYASALKPIMTLIDSGHWYVVANFRETDLEDVRSGTAATVYLISDSGRRFKGRVDSVGFGVLPDDGGAVIEGLPRVERSINWVRVSQRFPVKIAVHEPDQATFRMGASAVAVLRRGEEAP